MIIIKITHNSNMDCIFTLVYLLYRPKVLLIIVMLLTSGYLRIQFWCRLISYCTSMRTCTPHHVCSSSLLGLVFIICPHSFPLPFIPIQAISPATFCLSVLCLFVGLHMYLLVKINCNTSSWREILLTLSTITTVVISSLSLNRY